MSEKAIISDQEMEHLKTLARLEINEEETQSLKEDLNKILDSFEQIKHLDTEGIEELARPVASHNVFRKDEIKEPLDTKIVQNLAVEIEEGFFKVPRTVDTDS